MRTESAITEIPCTLPCTRGRSCDNRQWHPSSDLCTARRTRRLRLSLDAPLSGVWCAVGWLIATAVFVELVKALGGLGPLDTYESVFSTWAIADGQFTCAFPVGYRVIAPVYPLVSGAVTALDHAGNAVLFSSPIRTRTTMRPLVPGHRLVVAQVQCTQQHARRRVPGSAGPQGGLVSLLRACGRGRCGWEPATVVVVAVLPPVWFCIQNTFHPQDLFAMGFALAAMACACRSAWAAAGVFIALAVLSQQFAVLVAVPLLVLAPDSGDSSTRAGPSEPRY